ncbi:MAG: VWA domain-containing protein [Acidobacteria bacterium]|nr:VWA domain-containing protein [Acidobacteriota bacterium]
MRAQSVNRWVAFFLGWMFFCPIFVASQTQDDPTPQPSGSGATSDEQYSFAVEIEVVTVPVTVTNSAGEFVTDLDKVDFQILDNGVPQQITDFDLSWEPLSLAIVVQTSSRIESLLPDVRRSGILFTQLILGESGEAAILTFDSEIKLLQDFTSDPEKIEKTLENLKTGGEAVRLSDALARAVSLLKQRPPGRRKVIVVISEARDSDSSNAQGLVLRGAQQLGISVYAVGLSSFQALLNKPPEGPSSPFPPGVVARPMPGNQPPTPDAQTGWGTANINLLELITELVRSARSWTRGNPLSLYAAGTGGTEFSSGGTTQLENALGRIGQELHSQYLLTYRPHNLEKPGFHLIQVTVFRPNVHVRHRPGYLFTQPVSRRTSPPGNPSTGQEKGPSRP